MDRGRRGNLESRGLRGRSELALHWYELLMFIEFKMTKKALMGKNEAKEDQEVERQDLKKPSRIKPSFGESKTFGIEELT